ncbi:MAG: FHA domain-containing protein, partial [Desulfobulbaceae bacterium]|nr:FHA domain-containing protein [Desulfobulbaceae bacterium]
KIDTDEPVSESDTIVFGKFILAPADPTDSASRVSASVATDMMNIDDETVFVTGKKQPSPSTQFKAKGNGPKITVIKGNASPKTLSLAGTSSLKIGSDSSCDLVVSGWFVAKAQAYIIKRENDYLLVPQRSWVGTYLNDCKISSEQILRSGDIISIRSVSLRFD